MTNVSDTLPAVIIVGLGNPILSDDGVGWRVAHAVREGLASRPDLADRVVVDIVEACVGGLSLAELLVGYERAVIVDAIMTKRSAPGTIRQFTPDELPGTLNMASAHDTNFVTALRALRRFGAALPTARAISIVAVEAEDVWTFSETCTPAVEAAIPLVTALVIDAVAAIAESVQIRP